MERIVGIDLGTTNSLIAYTDEETPRVLADAHTGSSLLPSVVSFLPDGTPLVGPQAALREAAHPLSTLRSVKRFMGLGMEHVSDEDRRRYAFAQDDGGKKSRPSSALPCMIATTPRLRFLPLSCARSATGLRQPCTKRSKRS